MAVLGRADALVFTGGIGEHDPLSRGEIAAALCGLGFEMDRAANEADAKCLRRISAQNSQIAVYVVPAEEDLMIARHVARMCRESPTVGDESP
jgi:acetate kinase